MNTSLQIAPPEDPTPSLKRPGRRSTVRDPEEFKSLATGLQAEFLAELLGVSRQMVHRYRRKGAPASKVDQLRAYLQEKAAA